MKIRITYKPDETASAELAKTTLATVFPDFRIHESEAQAGVKCTYLTITKRQKPQN